MKRTDLFKGCVFQLLSGGLARRYFASYDITAHTVLLNGTTVHLAFAKDGDDNLAVSLYTAGKIPIISHITRSATELIEDSPEGKYCLEVYPDHVLRFLQRIGLSKAEMQNLVEKARYELNSD